MKHPGTSQATSPRIARSGVAGVCVCPATAPPLISRRLWLAACIACAIGCRRAPEFLPIPPQKPPLAASDPPPLFLKFSDPAADKYVVRDILAGDFWRWTRDHPEMQFPVDPQPGLRFVMRFHIDRVTFRDTGPVTVVVNINGHKFASVYCASPAMYELDRPVPLEWLHSGEPIRVLAEASPMWTSPGGDHLGYLLEAAGFRL